MRLTETQKNFRKQMAEINKQKGNIYDNPRKTNPFARAKNGKGTLVIFSIILLVSTFIYLKNNQINNFKQSQMAYSGIPVIQSSQGAMPNNYADFLMQLDQNKPQFDSIAMQILQMHQIPVEQRDVNKYQNLLINGVKVCRDWQNAISKVEPVGPFQALIAQRRHYLFVQSLAYEYYLDYTYSNNITDLDKAKHFSEQANEAGAAFQQHLIEVLKQEKYQYEITPDGVRYWYITNGK